MGYTAAETNEKRSEVAIELLRHKALVKIGMDKECLLDEQDINEILIVAGHKVIVPEEINKKELEVI